jgi:SsrA-binding protein
MAEKPQNRKIKIIAQNRKARHDYEVVSTLEAGIVLTGTEVKALRAGQCNLQDSYAAFQDKNSTTLLLMGAHISPYDHGNRENHEPRRTRTLLLHQREILRLKQAIQEKGLTIVPLSLYFSGPYIKVELAVVKGKKLYDKREDSKKRDVERELRRGDY